MKSLLKRTFASCLGTLLAIFVVFLAILIGTSLFYSKKKPNQKGVLHLMLNGNITDYSQATINPTKLDFNPTTLSLWDIKNKIKAASEDKNITGLYIESKSVNVSLSSALEIIEYLEAFKSAGKKIYAYSNYYNQNAYAICTVADSIFLNPGGGIDLKGYAVYAPFFTEIFKKLNIDMNIYVAGKYKGSVESYKLNEFSSNNKYQLKEYLDHSESELTNTISKFRKADIGQITEILESNSAFEAKSNLQYGLIDKVAYHDEFEDALENEFGKDELVSFTEYEIKKSKSKNATTALVFMEGEIIWGDGETGVIGHESYTKILKKIRKDDKIKNVILRINSPGGSGFASDLIHRELQLIKKSGKKIYTSIGGMATSGAYYIAAISDTIVSTSNSLTGSIGVYIMFPTIDRLVEGELGINIDSVSSAANTITFSPLFKVSEKQEERLKQETEDLYKQFLGIVASGRELPIDSVKSIAQGRLWTGESALEIGLTDLKGSLNKTLQLVSQENKDERIQIYPQHKKTLAEEIISQGLGSMEVKANIKYLTFLEKASEIEKLIKNPVPMMRIPFNNFVTKR